MRNLRNFGKFAESKAEKFLQQKGYKILQKNYMIRGGEIDLIAKYKEKYIFIEVKSLTENSKINIFETISKKKLNTLVKTAEKWLSENTDLGIEQNWNIDFVGIVFYDKKVVKNIVHLTNVIA